MALLGRKAHPNVIGVDPSGDVSSLKVDAREGGLEKLSRFNFPLLLVERARRGLADSGRGIESIATEGADGLVGIGVEERGVKKPENAWEWPSIAFGGS